jgi:putative hemolysin
MTVLAPKLRVRLAENDADLRAAQRLRYRVFVEELGGDGPMVDHRARLERDRFDPFFDHLVLVDEARDPAACDHVVGVYRLLRDSRAKAAGQFYSEDEYDLEPLRRTGRKLLELGRSCVDVKYRGGPALFHLWTGLADYVAAHGVEILFGVASFHGTAIAPIRAPLSLLHHRYLAPPDLRVRAQPESYQPMDLMPEDRIDRAAAMRQVPALIKAYLRTGGFVGDGAYIDRAFNTTDVCLILDTARMTEKQRQLYARGTAR